MWGTDNKEKRSKDDSLISTWLEWEIKELQVYLSKEIIRTAELEQNTCELYTSTVAISIERCGSGSQIIMRYTTLVCYYTIVH